MFPSRNGQWLTNWEGKSQRAGRNPQLLSSSPTPYEHSRIQKGWLPPKQQHVLRGWRGKRKGKRTFSNLRNYSPRHTQQVANSSKGENVTTVYAGRSLQVRHCSQQRFKQGAAIMRCWLGGTEKHGMSGGACALGDSQPHARGCKLLTWGPHLVHQMYFVWLVSVL